MREVGREVGARWRIVGMQGWVNLGGAREYGWVVVEEVG